MLSSSTECTHDTALIPWDEAQHGLGHDSMDATHEVFVQLVNSLANADKQRFISLFTELYEHTQAHFAAEDLLMKKSGFAALEEHMSEHRRVLGEMTQLLKRVQKGSLSFARAYVRERLPEWFALHLMSMDQALAVHLHKQS